MIDKKARLEIPKSFATEYREVEYFLYLCGTCKAEWKMDVFIDSIFCPLCGRKDAPLSVGDGERCDNCCKLSNWEMKDKP